MYCLSTIKKLNASKRPTSAPAPKAKPARNSELEKLGVATRERKVPSYELY
jgi:hypothetical protein